MSEEQKPVRAIRIEVTVDICDEANWSDKLVKDSSVKLTLPITTLTMINGQIPAMVTEMANGAMKQLDDALEARTKALLAEA
ncbi:hypothetical protein ACFLXQ_01530 [Chloroflexota bacterium]